MIAYSKQRANPIKTLAASQKLALLETVIPRASQEAEFQPSAVSGLLETKKPTQPALPGNSALPSQLSEQLVSAESPSALTQPSPSSSGSFRELI